MYVKNKNRKIMNKNSLKKVLDQLSQDNMNLIVNNNIVAGSVSGSWWTISGNIFLDTKVQGAGGWSISDLWDNCDCVE